MNARTKRTAILFRTWSTSDHDSGDCDYAIAAITPELVKTILARARAFKALQKSDERAFEIYFWDGHCDYYSEAVIHAGIPRHVLEALEDNGDFVIVPPDVDTSTLDAQRTECDQMIVTEDSAGWVAIPKHTSLYVTTSRLSLATLKDLVELKGRNQASTTAEPG